MAYIRKPKNPDLNNKVYDFVVGYKKNNNGNSPTIREICDGIGVNSTSMIRDSLQKLTREGLIVYGQNYSPRSIVVVGGTWALS